MAHTFYVGESEWLVHNVECCNSAWQQAANLVGSPNRYISARGSQLADMLLTQNRLDRVAQVPGGLAGAIEYEATTGIKHSKNFHFEKGQVAISQLDEFIRQVNNSIDISQDYKSQSIKIAQEQRDQASSVLQVPRVPSVK